MTYRVRVPRTALAMTTLRASCPLTREGAPVIRAIAYASCYVYSPAGTGFVCEQSRLMRALLKAGNARFMLKYAVRVRQQSTDSPLLAGYFGATDVLIPVPGSTPTATGRLWAAGYLADALVDVGLGGRAWCGLHRVRAVRKSATASPGERPTVSSIMNPSASNVRPRHPKKSSSLMMWLPKGERCWPRQAACMKRSPPLKSAHLRWFEQWDSYLASSTCWTPAKERFVGRRVTPTAAPKGLFRRFPGSRT